MQYDHLNRALDGQISVFPQHRKFLEKRFKHLRPEQYEFVDRVAGMILRIAGHDSAEFWSDYRWTTRNLVEEEFYFQRHKKYRLTTFAEARAEVYDNREYMERYIRGLLATQIWWSNHTDCLQFFRDKFLLMLPDGFSLVDVGPGHGLFLWLATEAANFSRAEGWDVSDASITVTRRSLGAMGIANDSIPLKHVDVMTAGTHGYDAAVFSEVLEHLEAPLDGLRAIYRLLKPGGLAFINAPVNSPAPDHLWLFRTPEEVVKMAQDAGFAVEASLFAPYTGLSLEQARKHNVTISVALIARRPE